MPRPLRFTKSSCEYSLLTAGLEEICKEVVSACMQVCLGTLSDGVCVCFSKRSIFQLTRKELGGDVEHQTLFVSLYQLALMCVYLFLINNIVSLTCFLFL